MATSKDQPQSVVAQFLRLQHVFRLGQFLFQFGEPLQFVALGIKACPAAYHVHAFVVCGGNQPRSRVIGDSPLRPLFQRRGKCLLHHLFRQIKAPQQANQRRQDSPRLLPINALDVHPATRTQVSRSRESNARACHAERSVGLRLIPSEPTESVPPPPAHHRDPWLRSGNNLPAVPWFQRTGRR